MPKGDSQDHSTVPPTLEGRANRPEDITIIVLQLQNDFALLRYLLFSSVGTIPVSDTSVQDSATSPLINSNPNPKPTSNALLIPCSAEPLVCRSTPEGALDHPERTQTTLQTLTFSPHPTHGKPLQLRRKTSHQEFPCPKNYLQMN